MLIGLRFRHIVVVTKSGLQDFEAKGPVFARSRQIETIHDEDDFCMQIDAHTDVVEGWVQ